MTAEIRYQSRSGNTRKIAEAIERAAGEKALPITEELKAPVDILFLGGAVYGFQIAPELAEYINKLDPSKIGKVVLFSTSALGKSVYAYAKKLIEARGIAVDEDYFHCKGKFSIMNRNRPSAEDVKRAELFTCVKLQKKKPQ